MFWEIPGKCEGCRNEYDEDDEKPPCYHEEPCIITKRKRVQLNYDEFRLFNDFLDFWATGQLLTRNKRKRELLLMLEGKAIEFQKFIGKRDANTRS